MKDERSGNLSLQFNYWKDRHHRHERKVLRAKTGRSIFAFGYETQCTFVRLHCNQRGPVITSSWRDKMAAKKRGGRKAAKKGGRKAAKKGGRKAAKKGGRKGAKKSGRKSGRR
jgi:hypothetical protein